MSALFHTEMSSGIVHNFYKLYWGCNEIKISNQAISVFRDFTYFAKNISTFIYIWM